MLEAVLKLAEADAGVHEVYLHVQTSNNDALNFYKRFGFEVKDKILNYYKRIDPPGARPALRPGIPFLLQLRCLLCGSKIFTVVQRYNLELRSRFPSCR